MIETWSPGSAGEHMDEAILTQLAPLVARHPWWGARARFTLALLKGRGTTPPARVLDAGCGWGVTLRCLEEAGYSATGLDVSRSALERLDRPGRRLIEADLTGHWDAPEETFDAVLALDVIEHLDDDRSAIRVLADRVVPGGVLIASVPALPEMFGEFDAIQGHRRRYLPDSLRDAFVGSGLGDPDLFWWGRWLARRLGRSRARPRSRPGEPAWRTYRRYLALPPWPLPILIRGMFLREHREALSGRLTTGTSLFAVARRPR